MGGLGRADALEDIEGIRPPLGVARLRPAARQRPLLPDRSPRVRSRRTQAGVGVALPSGSSHLQGQVLPRRRGRPCRSRVHWSAHQRRQTAPPRNRGGVGASPHGFTLPWGLCRVFTRRIHTADSHRRFTPAKSPGSGTGGPGGRAGWAPACGVTCVTLESGVNICTVRGKETPTSED